VNISFNNLANLFKSVYFGRDVQLDRTLRGRIYSIRVYNRALSEEEIETNYNTDKARFEI